MRWAIAGDRLVTSVGRSVVGHVAITNGFGRNGVAKSASGHRYGKQLPNRKTGIDGSIDSGARGRYQLQEAI